MLLVVLTLSRRARRSANTRRPLPPYSPRRWRGYGLLVAFMAVVPLAEARVAGGDAQRGRQIFLDRELGHCILCHQTKQVDAPFQGNLGPELSDVAARLTAAEIRAKVTDPTVANPESAMPAFRRTQGLRQVADARADKPILTAEQLADLMAFLVELRDSHGAQPKAEQDAADSPIR